MAGLEALLEPFISTTGGLTQEARLGCMDDQEMFGA